MSESFFRQRPRLVPPPDEDPPAWMQALLPVVSGEPLDEEGAIHALQVWPATREQGTEAARLVVVAGRSNGPDPLAA